MKHILFKKIAAIALIAFFVLPSFALERGNVDYAKVYGNLKLSQTKYINNEDPLEYDDYQEYILAPYPLIRISSHLICHGINVKPGYYLLTPREINGQDFVLFKQKGKVQAIVPAYEKATINPNDIYPNTEPPKKKSSMLAKIIKFPFVAIKKTFGLFFGWAKKPPKMQKSALESFNTGNDYFRINFYLEDKVYKMVFKTRKVESYLPMPGYSHPENFIK